MSEPELLFKPLIFQHALDDIRKLYLNFTQQ